MMTPQEYQSFAQSIRLAPSVHYPLFGLLGETGEIAEKVKRQYRGESPPVATEIIKELGDCLWYASSVAADLGIKFANLSSSFCDIPATAIADSAISARDRAVLALGIVSRHLVENALSYHDGDDGAHLSHGAWYLTQLLRLIATIARGYGSTIGDVAEANYQKLSSRKARGTLLGNGDNR